MSTTLKALQRLEHSQPRSGADDMVAVGPGLKNKPGKAPSGQWGRLVIIAFIALLAGVAVLVYLIGAKPSREYRAAVIMPAEPLTPGSKTVDTMAGPAAVSPSTRGEGPPATQTVAESASLPDGVELPFETAVMPWHGEGIKVQAVVCGPDPAATMAVINNRTVRQGDRVGDYTVADIEKNAVIVSLEGERWRVVLGR